MWATITIRTTFVQRNITKGEIDPGYRFLSILLERAGIFLILKECSGLCLSATPNFHHKFFIAVHPGANLERFSGKYINVSIQTPGAAPLQTPGTKLSKTRFRCLVTVWTRDARGSIFLLRGGAGQEIFFSGRGRDQNSRGGAFFIAFITAIWCTC